MGQEYSAPKPGTKFQVIGAGLPRTGTASFTEALSILLDGPIYHGGTTMIKGPEIEPKSWTRILQLLFPHTLNKAGAHVRGMTNTTHSPLPDTITMITPTPTPSSPKTIYDSKKDIPSADRTEALKLLHQRMSGYAAVTDSPACSLVPELLEIYPDALVICTIRDIPSWSASMATIASAAAPYILRFILFPLPTLRLFPYYVDGLMDQWGILYGETSTPTEITWERHVNRLKEVVPMEQLIFFDVKDGWGPLCKALGKEVPRDGMGREVEFPRINDGEAIDRLARSCVRKGVLAWVGILGAVGVVVWGSRSW